MIEAVDVLITGDKDFEMPVIMAVSEFTEKYMANM